MRSPPLATLALCGVVGAGCVQSSPSRDAAPVEREEPAPHAAPELARAAPEKPTCASGRRWTEGDEGSPLMLPGSDCMECHTDDAEPKFAAAGTVYDDYHAPDDCFGVEGLTVRIIDSKGLSFLLTTNEAGNFWIDFEDAPDLAYPIGTQVIDAEGGRAIKTTPLFSGACNACHVAKTRGRGRAKGRIVPLVATQQSD